MALEGNNNGDLNNTDQEKKDIYIKNGSACSGSEQKTGFHKQELRRSNEPDNPELNKSNLKRAAKVIFNAGNIRFTDQFRELSEHLYSVMDLEKRGSSLIVTDTKLLIDLFFQSFNWIFRNSTKKERTNRLTILGCGPGRLAQIYIELAKLFGIDKIIFNDVIEEHIERTRDKVDDIYGDENKIDGVNIKYVTGDFTDSKLTHPEKGVASQLKPSDIVVAMWFVTSEILSLESSQEHREKRLKLYETIAHLIGSIGVFIEDIPDSQAPNFYRDLRLLTGLVLKEMNITQLDGEDFNFGLTYLTDVMGEKLSIDSTLERPAPHIRYLPYNGLHKEEVFLGGGLVEIDSRSSLLPGSLGYVQIDTSNLFSELDKPKFNIHTPEGFRALKKELEHRMSHFPCIEKDDTEQRKRTLLFAAHRP